MRALLDRTFTPAQRSAFKNALLHPVLPDFGDGFYPAEGSGTQTWNWAQQRAELDLVNLRTTAQRVTIDASLGGQGDLAISVAGHTGHYALTSTATTPWHQTLTLPAGTTKVRFDMHGTPMPGQNGDTRSLYFQVADLDIAQPGLTAAACAIEPPGPTRPASCR
jgi:hypothetical protein